MSTRAPTDEEALIRRARTGNHAAFELAVGPYLDQLRRHCYRMTASVDDADDILQETLFRSWRGLGNFQGRSSFRTWLFQIATNRSLDVVSGRAWRDTNSDPTGDPIGEPSWLQPFPTSHLGAETDPAEIATEIESIGLAYIVALQELPARQRAVVILCDVLGFRSTEVAKILSTSTAAVNSALQRARRALPLQRERTATANERALASDFVTAWNAGDLKSLVAILADDIVLTMPPDPLTVTGGGEVLGFLAEVLGGSIEQGRLVEVEANGQFGAAVYGPVGDDPMGLHGLMMFTIGDERIVHLTGFPQFAAADHFDHLTDSL